MQPTMNPGLPYNLEAVGIHIYNPTVDARQMGTAAPGQYVPQEQQLDKSYYNVPQNAVYGNQPGMANAYAAYAAPMMAQPPQMPQAPVQPQPAATPVAAAPAPVPVPPPQIDQVAPAPVQPQPAAAPVAAAPAPVQPQPAPAPIAAAPAPVQPQPAAAPVAAAPAPVQPQPAPVQQAPAQAAPEQAAQTAQAKPAEQPVQQDPAKAAAQELIAGLQGPVAKQTETIQKLADLGQNNPQQATELLKTAGPDILQGLVNVFNQKAEGADAKAIDDNKRIAMYTTAIMQKNFRNAMNGQIKTLNQQQGQNIPQVGITELPAINELVMKMSPEAEPNPEVRTASIQALNFLAQPEDNATLTELFNAVIGVPNDPQKPGDPDPNVKAAAQQALAALPPAPAAAPEQAQQPAPAQPQAA